MNRAVKLLSVSTNPITFAQMKKMTSYLSSNYYDMQPNIPWLCNKILVVVVNFFLIFTSNTKTHAYCLSNFQCSRIYPENQTVWWHTWILTISNQWLVKQPQSFQWAVQVGPQCSYWNVFTWYIVRDFAVKTQVLFLYILLERSVLKLYENWI